MDSIEKRAKEYNSSNDFNGAIGRSIADALLEKYGSIENIPDFSKEDASKVQKILSEYSPKEVYNSTRQRQLLKGMFRRLKKTGMEIKNYKRMNDAEMVNYFMFLRRENKVN